jgi:glutathione S-transferase
MHKVPEVTLFDDTHCPYSERARRALGERGVYQYRRTLPWHERSTVERETGQASVPVLQEGGRFIVGSSAIARHAEHLGAGDQTMFPREHLAAIAAWERRANEIAEVTFPLAVPVWASVMTDDVERAAFLARHRRYGEPAELTKNRLQGWRVVMALWRECDTALTRRDYLLGPLTYADLALYGSVYLAAQFNAFEIPQSLSRLAAWYESIRTAGLMRDQELILAHTRSAHPERHTGEVTRGTSRYGDPPHHPEDANRQNY